MSKNLVTFLIIFVIPKIDTTPTDLRIVGGRLAREGEFPFQVALRRSYNDQFFCGGSIITPKHILTAAHCMFYMWGGLLSPLIVSVTAGQLGLAITPTTIYSNASKITLHPDYDHETMENDIAVVELRDELPFTPLITRVALNNRAVPPNTTCTVSGCGVDNFKALELSRNLLATEVYTVDFEECQSRYESDDVELFDGMLCAADDKRGTDACQGDSGGPLTCGGVLTGIVSTGNGCADIRYPGIYTDVQFFLPWIKAVIDRTIYVTRDVTVREQNGTDVVTVSDQSVTDVVTAVVNNDEQTKISVFVSNSTLFKFVFMLVENASRTLSLVAPFLFVLVMISLIF